MKNKVDFSKLKKAENKPDIEAAIKHIHEKPPIEKEKTSRVSVDTPIPMFKQIKQRMLDLDIKTMKDYFLNLAKKDLGMD